MHLMEPKLYKKIILYFKKEANNLKNKFENIYLFYWKVNYLLDIYLFTGNNNKILEIPNFDTWKLNYSTGK